MTVEHKNRRKVGSEWRCDPDCYACERTGLQERVRFTADYETVVHDRDRYRHRVQQLEEAMNPMDVPPEADP